MIIEKTFIELRKALKSLFSSDRAIFELQNGFLMVSILAVLLLYFFYQIYLLIYFHVVTLDSMTLSSIAIIKEGIFDHILVGFAEYGGKLFLCFVLMFLVGVYISGFLIRPFHYLGEFFEEATDKPELEYEKTFFAEHRLLSSFTEHFFTAMKNIRSVEDLKESQIPKKYSKIHSPYVEMTFLLHFFLLLAIPFFATAIIIISIADVVMDKVTDISYKISKTASFQAGTVQAEFMEVNLYSLAILALLCYVLLGFVMYQRVSGGSFGIFLTLRSFLKGKTESRVHLIGYRYLREHMRKINRYLDHLVRKLSEKKTAVKKEL